MMIAQEGAIQMQVGLGDERTDIRIRILILDFIRCTALTPIFAACNG